MEQIKAEIIFNKEVRTDRFRMRLKAPAISKDARPGQFVMVKCSDGPEPFLRRPLSFHRIEGAYFELLYQAAGKGTEILSRRKKGEMLDIIGPLGNGFNIGILPGGAGGYVLIAGGIGAAPLLALAEGLKKKGLKVAVLIGARTEDHVLCADEFRVLGTKVIVCTEDGSLGRKGLITDVLRRELQNAAYDMPQAVYACGPREMLRAAARIAESNKIQCLVSFEERMACGTGACLGCAVKTAAGYKMACKDGPVFDSGDIIW